MRVYVAGPFRGPDGWAVARNIRAAEELGFQVAQAGHVPVIPHSMYGAFDRTLTDAFWIKATLELLSVCDAIVFVPGWECSEGSCGELRYAAAHDIPLFHLT